MKDYINIPENSTKLDKLILFDDMLLALELFQKAVLGRLQHFQFRDDFDCCRYVWCFNDLWLTKRDYGEDLSTRTQDIEWVFSYDCTKIFETHCASDMYDFLEKEIGDIKKIKGE